MHNCKLTRRDLIDLALNELPEARSAQLLAELNDCEACQIEYASLRSTLHVSNQALRSALPAEEFWPGYHSRLKSRLLTSEAQQIERTAVAPLTAQPWLAFRSVFMTSVRVPLPAALALILLFGVSFFFLRTRTEANASPSTPSSLVETRTIEVPVVQEKVVTRVVYVEKKGDKFRTNRRRAVPVMSARPDSSATTALGLTGFKPTEEVKLTVIKGSYKDEKR